MTVAAIVARTEFQARLVEAATAKGLKVQEILRIYQPYTAQEPIECLIVDPDVGAITVWCDPTGEITRGPKLGFGLGRGETLEDD